MAGGGKAAGATSSAVAEGAADGCVEDRISGAAAPRPAIHIGDTGATRTSAAVETGIFDQVPTISPGIPPDDDTPVRLVARKRLERHARGLKALDDHPEGFSRPDMMAWPEYARKVAARLPHAAGDDPRPRAYDQGFAARLSGKSLEENPFRPDTSDHLAWEGGWSDSADQTRAARTA